MIQRNIVLSLIGFFIITSASAAFAARLPSVGGDADGWGTVLNDYLTSLNTSINTISGSLSGYLPLSGGTLSGDVNLGNKVLTASEVNTSSASGALHLQQNADSSGRVRLFRNTTGNPMFNIWGYDSGDAIQKYITIMVDSNLAYTEAGTSARARAIITSGGNGAGDRNALELQSPSQIRITAVDNNIANGNVRIAAKSYTTIHSRTGAETDASKYIIFDTVGDATGANPTIETNSGDLVLAPGSGTVSVNGVISASNGLTLSSGTLSLPTDSVTDAMVANNITASNYLPLSGGFLTGDVNMGAKVLTTSEVNTSSASGTLHLQQNADSSGRVRFFRNTTGNPMINIWGYDSVNAVQKYITIGVFNDLTYFTEAGASSRAIITSGGNTAGTRNALELQSPDQIRITAVDNILQSGKVRIAADTTIELHPRTAAETDSAKRIIIDTSGGVRGDGTDPVIKTNSGNLVLDPADRVNIKDVLKLQPITSPPSSPTLGDIYVDDTGALCFYEAGIVNAWNKVSGTGTCA